MHVKFHAEKQSWLLTWQRLLFHLQLKDGVLASGYFGQSRQFESTVSQETLCCPDDFPYRDNIWRTRAEAIVQIAPGDQPVMWSLHSWSQPDSDAFTLVLQATDLPLQCELKFTADEETGLLRRRTTLRHTGSGPALDISQANSVAALLPAEVRNVVHLTGRWCGEGQVQQSSLEQGPLLLESRSGKTSFEMAPYLALQTPDTTYLCELLWSGNWHIHARRLFDGRVTISGGLNNWGFHHRLRPGAQLALPDSLLACVEGDLNAATQRLHDYRRRQLRPDPDRLIPVQFNSWYPFLENTPADKMKEVAAHAARLGCEVFVLDAGWYTTETEDPKDTWWTRTGDWVVNRRLFPNGLEELSRACKELGIGFGIWFEPEAVGRNALIRREHPVWLHYVGGRPTPPDKRGVLHLGVPEAREWMRERILKILRSTDAAWLKWDFNTDLGQGGWAPELPKSLTDQDPLVAHYEGLYLLQDELRAALPGLTLEMCAGGGGRFDPAIMSHAHTTWMSDHCQSLANLSIHFGSQLAHPAIECNDWLSEFPPPDELHPNMAPDLRGDLAFRLRVAMLGTFGISAPLQQWPAADVALAREHVTWYKKKARPVIHYGDQYLLTPAPPLNGEGDWAAVWYAAKDASRGILFAFRLAGREAERSFALPGLDPTRTYRLSTPEGKEWRQQGAELAAGLTVSTEKVFRSALIAVERE